MTNEIIEAARLFILSRHRSRLIDPSHEAEGVWQTRSMADIQLRARNHMTEHETRLYHALMRWEEC